MEYGFSHDEIDASTQLLRQSKWAHVKDAGWRQPSVFGPAPGPSLDENLIHDRDRISTLRSRTAKMTFKTSATKLRNLFANAAFSFVSRDTMAYASFRMQRFDDVPWLSGRGYSIFGLYIHGVQYKSRTGEVVTGSYVPVMFSNQAEAITSGREELGLPVLFADISIEEQAASFLADISWQGTTWATMKMPHIQQRDSASSEKASQEIILVQKSMPSTSSHKSPSRDAEYAVALESSEKKRMNDGRAEWRCDRGASLNFDAADKRKLPTLHHIVSRLEELPIFEVVDASVVETTADPGLRVVNKLS